MGLDMANSSALALTGLNKAQEHTHTYTQSHVCTYIFERTVTEKCILLSLNLTFLKMNCLFG